MGDNNPILSIFLYLVVELFCALSEIMNLQNENHWSHILPPKGFYNANKYNNPGTKFIIMNEMRVMKFLPVPFYVPQIKADTRGGTSQKKPWPDRNVENTIIK